MAGRRDTAVLGLLATALAYLTMQTIARSVSPLLASLGLLAVPVVGLVASSIVLREPLGPVDLAGIAVCLAGIALVTTARLPVPLEADSERPGMAIPTAEGAPR